MQSVQDGDLDRVSSDMKKVAPFIEQVKVLSQVFTEQDAAIAEMKQSTQKSDEKMRKLMEAATKRIVNQAVAKLTLKIDSLEIQMAS